MYSFYHQAFVLLSCVRIINVQFLSSSFCIAFVLLYYKCTVFILFLYCKRAIFILTLYCKHAVFICFLYCKCTIFLVSFSGTFSACFLYGIAIQKMYK